jgi:hypothetical protein
MDLFNTIATATQPINSKLDGYNSVENYVKGMIPRRMRARGYWKHSIVMKISREVGSLSEAWKIFNDIYFALPMFKTSEREIRMNREAIEATATADLSNEYGRKGTYYGD